MSEANHPPRTWDERVLAQLPADVDLTQIEANLALSPTERVRKMTRFLTLAAEIRRGATCGLRSDPDRA